MRPTLEGQGRPISLALAALVLGLCTFLVAGSRALAASSTNCGVNASVGYVNCLNFSAPSYEIAKAHHTAGLAYRFQLHRPSDGAKWGYWHWNDLDYHTVMLGLSGSVTAQIDNLGTANPASYYIEMG